MKKLLISFILLSLSLFAGQDSFHQKVRVDYSKPVYETIEEIIPHRHTSNCYKEIEVRTPRHSRSNYDENIIGLDTIIGVASGVIIGHQMGKGNGKVAAKVIGGLIGGKVANSMRNSNTNHHGQDYYYETKKVESCNHEDRIVRKNVLKGYDNFFTYRGKKYSKFDTYERKFVKIRNTISF